MEGGAVHCPLITEDGERDDAKVPWRAGGWAGLWALLAGCSSQAVVP